MFVHLDVSLILKDTFAWSDAASAVYDFMKNNTLYIWPVLIKTTDVYQGYLEFFIIANDNYFIRF